MPGDGLLIILLVFDPITRHKIYVNKSLTFISRHIISKSRLYLKNIELSNYESSSEVQADHMMFVSFHPY